MVLGSGEWKGNSEAWGMCIGDTCQRVKCLSCFASSVEGAGDTFVGRGSSRESFGWCEKVTWY